MPSFDNHINFGYSTVMVAPSPATSGTSLTLATGGGALMPATPFNATVWPQGTGPLLSNAEIVRVTAVVGDVLTIVRTQEGTSARAIAVGDQFANTISKKVLTDVEDAINALPQFAVQSIAGGTTVATGPQVSLVDGGGISWGITGNSIGATVAGGGGGGPTISAGGNSRSTGTVNLSASNGITFGMDGAGVVTASYTVPSTVGLISAINFSAGTTSGNQTAIKFGDANGITFGLNLGTITASHNGLTSQSNQAFSADGGSSTFQTLQFADANGFSFSNNNGSIQGSYTVPVQSNQTLKFFALNNTTGESSSSTFDARTISFAGMGIASVGMSGGSLIISVPSGGGAGDGVNIVSMATSTFGGATGGATFSSISGSIGLHAGSNITISQTSNSIIFYGGAGGGANPAFSAGGNSSTFQTLQFADSLGMFWTNTLGSVALASLKLSLFAGSNTTQSSSGTQNHSALTFAGAGAISVGVTNGTIVFSAPNTIAQTNQTVGIYGSSQTTGQSSSSTVDARSITFVGAGAISVGMSGGSIVFSAPNTIAQTNQSAIKGFGVSNTGSSLGNTGVSTGIDWVIAASGGITASQSTVGGGPNTVWLSVPNAIAQTNQTLGIFGSSQTTGQSSSSTVDARSITFVGQGIVSVGLSAGSILFSATQSNQAFSAAGGSSAFQTLNFADTNGLSWTNTNGSIGLASIKLSLFAVSNTTQSSSGSANHTAISFAGAGIASVGVTNGTVVVSASQTNVAFSAAGGASNFQTLNFADTNGVSFTNTNGSVGVASVKLSLFAVSNTTQSSSGSANHTALSFAGAGAASVGVTNGTVVFSVPNTVAQTNQTLGLYASSNTYGQSSSSTQDARSITFVAQGALSVGMSGGSIVFSAPAAAGDGVNIISMGTSTYGGGTGGTTFSTSATTIGLYAGSNITISQSSNSIIFYGGAGGGGGNVNFSAGTTSSGLASVVFSNANGISFGLNGATITASVPATSSLVGTNGMSVSTNGSTIFIQEAPGSYFEIDGRGASSSNTMANGTVYFQPFNITDPVSAYRINFLHHVTTLSATTASLSASVSSQTSSGGSNSWGQTGTLLLFSRVSTGTNVNSSNIVSFYSNSYSFSVGVSHSVTWSTNVSSATASFSSTGKCGFISSIDSLGGMTTGSFSSSNSSTFSSTSNAQNSFSASHVNSFLSAMMSGQRMLFAPFATSLPPGEYWLGHIYSSNSGTTAYNHSRNMSVAVSFAGFQSFTNTNYLEIGSSVAFSSSNIIPGWGSYSASSQTSTTIALSAISVQGGFQTFFNMMAQVK